MKLAKKNRKAWHKDETDSQVWLDEPSIKVMEILIIFFESIHTGHFDLGSEWSFKYLVPKKCDALQELS